MAGGPTLTVVLAASGPVTRQVQGVLRDWSAAGLVQDLLWIWEPDAAAGPLDTTAADLMVAGAVRRGRLQDLLADQTAATRLRLCVLSSLGGRPALVAEQVAARLRNSLTSRALTPGSSVHCVVTRHGQGGWDDACSWDQWHNVVLAPEDSSSPGAYLARQSIIPGDEDNDASFHGHAAAAMAAVAGLWRGMGQAPFDGRSLPGGPMTVVARCHLRRLDAAGVTAELRAEFADLGGEFPRPVLNGRSLEYLESPADACAEVVEQIVQRHPELFVSAREAVEEPTAIRVRWWQMLRWFFGFVWASLRSAPAQWLEQVSDRASSKVAQAVHAVALGGQESRYRVIVRGVDADGLKDDPLRLVEAAESLSVSVRRFGREERPLPSLESFWREVQAGACTLADGQEHARGLLGPTVSGRPGLVRRPAEIAPANADRLEVEQSLAARTVPQVQPYDVRSARLLHQALGALVSAKGGDARLAASQDEALQTWYGGLHRSFMVQVGVRLDNRLDACLREMIQVLDELRDAVPDQVAPEDVRGGARRLGVRIRRGLITASAVSSVFVVLAGLGWIPWYVVALAVVVCLGSWLFICAVGFISSAQAEFAQACARRPDDQRAAVLGRNLVQAARQVQLLSMAYAQYLCWAPVIAGFVAAPLVPGAVEAREPPRLGGILPRSVGLGRAVADRRAAAQLIDDARADTLRPGWLGHLWEQVLDRAPAQLGRMGRLLEPDALLRDRTVGDDSPLRAWSTLVQEDRVDPVPGEELWRQARESILTSGSASVTRHLFGRVEVGGRSTELATENGESFLTVLLRSLDGPRQFDTELFTASARNERAAEVELTSVTATAALLALAGPARQHPSVVTVEAVGGAGNSDLDQFVVVVETSGVFPGRGYLRLAGAAEPADEPPQLNGSEQLTRAEPDLHKLI